MIPMVVVIIIVIIIICIAVSIINRDACGPALVQNGLLQNFSNPNYYLCRQAEETETLHPVDPMNAVSPWASCLTFLGLKDGVCLDVLCVCCSYLATPHPTSPRHVSS